jgi:hypothetical protein
MQGRCTALRDQETLERIGCFDKEGGSGIVAAAAASYVAARTATRPVSGPANEKPDLVNPRAGLDRA